MTDHQEFIAETEDMIINNFDLPVPDFSGLQPRVEGAWDAGPWTEEEIAKYHRDRYRAEMDLVMPFWPVVGLSVSMYVVGSILIAMGAS